MAQWAADAHPETGSPGGTPRRVLVAPAGILAVAVIAMVLTLQLAGGAYEPPPAGLPDAGPVVAWGLPAVRLLTDLAGIVTAGFLYAAAFLSPQGKDGVISRAGRRDLITAAWAALAWSVFAIVQALLSVAETLGLPLARAMDPGIIATYAVDIPITRALILTAAAALLVAAGATVTATVGGSAIWMLAAVVIACLPQLAGHGSALGDHALAVSAGLGHVIGATLWVGGLIALSAHARRRTPDLPDEVRRFGYLAIACIVLLAASGLANAYTRLDSVSQLATTGYGQVVVIKVALLLAIGGVAAGIRLRVAPALGTPGSGRRFTGLALAEVTVMAAAVAAGVSLSLSPTPRIEGLLPTPGENLLGFAYPPAPTPATVVLGFRLEPIFLIGSLLAAGLYCWGVARLRARGDAWPVGRTISWLLGIGTVIWATNAGVATYAQVSVGLHMVQHMTLSMVAPMLLVLGAPFTLALRAIRPAPGIRRGPREWLVWLLHSPYIKVITNPLFVFALYAVGLYGLYFTPAFGWLMGNHIGHVWMQAHFLVVGYLFAWVIIGVDPLPYSLPYWARFGVLLIAIAIHAFFAIAIMSGTSAIGAEWYSQVRPPWISSGQADTNVGGQVAWGISEIPMLFMLVVMGAQWARSDAREARRKDRQADRDGDAELNAYNDYLRRLQERSSQ